MDMLFLKKGDYSYRQSSSNQDVICHYSSLISNISPRYLFTRSLARGSIHRNPIFHAQPGASWRDSKETAAYLTDTLYKCRREHRAYLRDILLVAAVMCTNSATEIASVVTEKLRRPIIKVLHQRSVMLLVCSRALASAPYAPRARILYALLLQRGAVTQCRFVATMRSNVRSAHVARERNRLNNRR